MNNLRMSTTQKNIEKALQQSILINKEEMKTEYIYSDYISFYRDVYFHCYSKRNIDFNRYIFITNKMIKNHLSHEIDEIKMKILKSIIKEHIGELKKLDSIYFSYLSLD